MTQAGPTVQVSAACIGHLPHLVPHSPAIADMVWRGLTKTTSYCEFTYQSRPEVPPCFVCHGFGFASPPFLLFFLSLLLLLPLISRIWQLQLLSWGHIVVWGQVAEERPDLCPGTMWRSGPRINDIIDWGHIFDQNWEWNLIMIRDYTGFDWKMKKIEIWEILTWWSKVDIRPTRAHLLIYAQIG